MPIGIKRAYEEAAEADGFRVLVDRIWPRGCKKENLRLNAWLKEIAPSAELRQWFGHEPERWEEFKRRYFLELEQCREPVAELLTRVKEGRVTLVYAARDEDRNNAVALREYLKREAAAGN